MPVITADNEPLITTSQATVPSPSAGGDRTSTTLPWFLGLFVDQRGGASMTVRQNVAYQLEDWRDNWVYSFLVVVLDTIWKLAFVVVSVVMLIWTARENPNLPVRVWICGYSLQCVVHVVLVWLEYKRRDWRRNTRFTIAESLNTSLWSFMNDDDDARITGNSPLIRWERLNTMISYIWWLIGSILMAFGGNILLHVAPRLFWLTLAFLALDVLFAAIGFLLSVLIGFSVCFRLPGIITFMYFIRHEEGASFANISILPKYILEVSNDDVGEPDGRTYRMVPVHTSVEPALLTQQDAECCICACSYENGSELKLLPCNHHFHGTCIMKWLLVKATCPLCNYNIYHEDEEV